MKRLAMVFLCMAVSLFSLGCGADQVVQPEDEAFDFNAAGIAPLLTSEAGRGFAANPWDVNGDSKIDLLDLVLVTQAFENATAPAIGPAVTGALKKGTKLSNGFYELELIDYTKGNYAALKITNVGNSSGLLTNLSGANFKVVSGGISNFVDLYWLGSIDLGESIVWRFHSTAMVNQMTGATAGLDKIVFQASSNMMFTQRSDYDAMVLMRPSGGSFYNHFTDIVRYDAKKGVYKISSPKAEEISADGRAFKPDYLGSHVIAIPIGEKIGAPIVFE